MQTGHFYVVTSLLNAYKEPNLTYSIFRLNLGCSVKSLSFKSLTLHAPQKQIPIVLQLYPWTFYSRYIIFVGGYKLLIKVIPVLPKLFRLLITVSETRHTRIRHSWALFRKFGRNCSREISFFWIVICPLSVDQHSSVNLIS